MDKIKKILGISSIVTLGICILLLLGALFKVTDTFNKDKVFLYILLSSAVICAGCFFSMSSLNFSKVNKILSYITTGLIWVTVVGALIVFFSKFSVPEMFSKVLFTIGIIAIFFVIIAGTYIKVGSNYKVLQAVTYILIIVIEIILILQLFGVSIIKDGFVKFFVAMCIIALALLATTNIIGKRVQTTEVKTQNGYISVKKDDYDKLVERVRELEEKLKKYE